MAGACGRADRAIVPPRSQDPYIQILVCKWQIELLMPCSHVTCINGHTDTPPSLLVCLKLAQCMMLKKTALKQKALAGQWRVWSCHESPSWWLKWWWIFLSALCIVSQLLNSLCGSSVILPFTI